VTTTTMNTNILAAALALMLTTSLALASGIFIAKMQCIDRTAR
jgi:hypothetical protein